ncbi:MAG: 5'/3'-nucleotidase SurE [Erysipelotrichaceae bacterium]|nr:5'/3'-nucleotidase SurE [Erysipelotrichaceae bacterium]
MNILVSNDDGIKSEAMKALVRELSKLGKVTVVAPNSQRSAFSHSMTIHGDLRAEKVDYLEGVEAWAIWGTPVDCVHIAMNTIIKEPLDLVVSGINQGPNLGTDIIYSGTIGAAREALIYGCPALAVSLDSYTSKDYQTAAEYAREVAAAFVKREDRFQYLLNLNIPVGEVRGLLVCDLQGHRSYDEGYQLVTKEDGHTYFMVGEGIITDEFDPDDLRYDINAISAGYATLTPLTLDQTSHAHVEAIREAFERV